MPAPRHIFETYVRATPDAVWRAITEPEFTRRYFHRTAIESSFAAGTPVRYVLPDGTDAVVGDVEEVEQGRRLVMTWRVLYDAALADEPPSRVEWVITPGCDGVTRVTTIHHDLALSPGTSASVGDGWPWILGSMKSLLETGEPLAGVPPSTGDRAFGGPDPIDGAGGELHRQLAVDANGATWALLAQGSRTADEDDDLLARAYAAAYHWRRAAGSGPANTARASWLVSRVHAVLGHGELALRHAERCAAAVAAAGLTDFDLAYAHEARARALACLGRRDAAAAELTRALEIPIADDEDRAIFAADLAADPWYGVPTPRPSEC